MNQSYHEITSLRGDMETWEWSEKYSVKVPAIDNQHKELFGYINQLNVTIEEGFDPNRQREVVSEVLGKLANYSIKHFEFEERLLELYNYEFKNEHKRAHQELYDRVTVLIEDFYSGEETVIENMFELLRNWLDDHILNDDHKFIPLLQGKNID